MPPCKWAGCCDDCEPIQFGIAGLPDCLNNECFWVDDPNLVNGESIGNVQTHAMARLSAKFEGTFPGEQQSIWTWVLRYKSKTGDEWEFERIPPSGPVTEPTLTNPFISMKGKSIRTADGLVRGFAMTELYFDIGTDNALYRGDPPPDINTLPDPMEFVEGQGRCLEVASSPFSVWSMTRLYLPEEAGAARFRLTYEWDPNPTPPNPPRDDLVRELFPWTVTIQDGWVIRVLFVSGNPAFGATTLEMGFATSYFFIVDPGFSTFAPKEERPSCACAGGCGPTIEHFNTDNRQKLNGKVLLEEDCYINDGYPDNKVYLEEYAIEPPPPPPPGP